MIKALEKRPVESEIIDNVASQITKRLMNEGVREIPSQQLGEWVMEALQELGQVAYVRFASVYRSFQDVNAFQEEIDKLVKATRAKGLNSNSNSPHNNSQKN